MNKVKLAHNFAMKKRTKVTFGRGGIDLMILGEPSESPEEIRKDVDFWLGRNMLGRYDETGKLHRVKLGGANGR